MIGCLDIETCTDPAWLFEQARTAAPLDLQAWLRSHAADGALSPWTGWCCCWAVAVGGEGDRVWSWSGADERAGLLELLDVLREAHPTPIVTHNGSAFDLPFLRLRALRYGLPDLARLLYQDKPRSGRLVDTADPSWVPRPAGSARKGWEYSLDAVAELLGVARKPTLPGRDVPLAAFEGRWDEIREHCEDDVVTLRRVYPLLAAGRAT